MGDAVMAFFAVMQSHEMEKKIDSAIDAINAGVYILEFMEQVVRPELGDHGSTDRIGVRLGIDYAKDDEIVWEITAFPELLKLQQLHTMSTLPQNYSRQLILIRL